MAYPNSQLNPNSAIPVWMASGGGVLPPGPGQSFLGYEQVDLSDAAAHGLSNIPIGTTIAVVYPEGGNVRWLVDATPTATNGIPLWGTSDKSFAASMLSTIKFIKMGGTTVKISVGYFGIAP